MAKAPVAGNAKTRLCPPFGLQTAARLAEAFLADVLKAAHEVDPGAALLAPAEDVADLAARFPGTTVLAQRGTSLGAALHHAAETGAVLVAGDAPGIAPSVIAAARASSADLTLAPSLDGGYCVVRARRFHPAVFTGVSWSTPSVLDETMAAARAVGLTVELLEPVADVDVAEDLLRLDLSRAPATAGLLGTDLAALLPRKAPAVEHQRTLHRSAWRRMVLDRLADGTRYGYLEVPDAVWIVPVTPSGETILVRQYRHPVRARPLEVPAGSVDTGEDPHGAAIRELREETGCTTDTLQRVGGFYSSSAHISLKGLVYLATDVRVESPTHAAVEGIEHVRMPFARAVALAEAGELCEAQSALALIQAWHAYAGVK